MEVALLYYVVILLFSFASMYCTFAPLAKHFEKNGKSTFFMQPILYIVFLYAISTIGAYYLSDNNDFLLKPDLLRISAPIFCVVLIYGAEWFFKRKISTIVLFFCIAFCVYLQPIEDKFVPFALNEYIFKCFIIVFFFIFCFYYSVLNILPHTITIPTITMLMGISFMAGVGGAPIYLAFVSASLIGSLFAYMSVNLHYVKIEFNDISCMILAFLICNLFIIDASELSFSSCLIFSMPFWAELTITLYNKFFVTKHGSLLENSHLLAVATKVTLATLMSNVFKIGLVCMFFGWFQLFSVNQYSLPIVTYFVVLWLNTSMAANLLQTPKTLKQINSEFITDIKQNLKETAETISKISNKKD